MTRSIAKFILVAMCGFVAASAPALGADKVTMSSTNITAFDLDQIVALAKGFFAKENIEFEPTYMQPDLVIKALLAGTVDLAKSGTHFGMIAATRGGELKSHRRVDLRLRLSNHRPAAVQDYCRSERRENRRRRRGQHHYDDLQRRHAAPGHTAVGIHDPIHRRQRGKISSGGVRPSRSIPRRSAAL